MSKRSPRLQFTNDEQTGAFQKADKASDKLDKAESKIPKKKHRTRVVDSDGKVTTKITFEEKKPPSKLKHALEAVPGETVLAAAHREVRQSEDENVGVESTHKLEEAAEGGVRAASHAHRTHQLRPYRNAARAEESADKANLKALNEQYEQEYGKASNPYSKWQQKRAIKKEYAAAKAGYSGGKTVSASEITANASRKTGESTKKVGDYISQHKKSFLVLGGIALIVVLLLNTASSCSVFIEGGASAIGMSTYPSGDSDMRSAEAQYCAKEAELQDYLDSYEQTHNYNEYHYKLDGIEHDPYVLISAITALKGGEWKAVEIGGILDMLFEKQYILTETISNETRYRTELVRDWRYIRDPYTGEILYDEYGYPQWEYYNRKETVPYTYYICTVELENFNLSHVPVNIMSRSELSLYAMYMGTLGNRPDLFPGSEYLRLYYFSEYEKYEIPPEVMADEQFAAIIEEAEKYLGFPYVWGGSSPATSFDCSGFVSYVYNNCGLGWSFGRLSAEGLRGICSHVSPANVKPGDLIFFQGTYDTYGASHVGIYVGNNMMLHCGDPIQYASLDSSYWQSHFMQFGRLP